MSALAERAARALDHPPGDPRPEPSLRRSISARLGDRWDLFVDALVPTETAALHAPNLARELRRRVASHHVVWSTSYPYSSHLACAAVARRAGVPLVVDLRDPWTLNWVHRRKFPHARWLERRAEAAVFRAAARVVVTTETLAAQYQALYPALAEKFVALHNCFDEGVAEVPAPAPLARRTVVHFGNVYGPWSLGTVFRALAMLRTRRTLAPSDLRLVNLGKLSDRDRALARELGVADLVAVLPPEPYAQGLARLRAADLLLLAAWDAPDAGLYLQGKLYDYLLAARPILAEGGAPELAHILGRTGAGVQVAPGDVAAMVPVLEGALDGRPTSARRVPEAVAYFSAREATGRLGALLDAVVGG
jgi:glycosyltransferase involved in cell wall biosynthesis